MPCTDDTLDGRRICPIVIIFSAESIRGRMQRHNIALELTLSGLLGTS
jgi:hypothetical protein